MKRFLIDTNVLLHDPKSIEVFTDNEVIIPISVLDELDQIKIRPDEKGRNARSVIRRLDELRATGSLNAGVKLPYGSTLRVELNHRAHLPQPLTDSVDNRLIRTALGLQTESPEIPVILVTKDINLRVKCDALGIMAQDYERDKLAKTPSALYGGFEALDVPSATIDQLYAQKVIDLEIPERHPNKFVLLRSIEREGHSGLGRITAEGRLRAVNAPPNGAWGIAPRNLEQKMALALLLDPNVKLVTLVGRAGSGKAQPLDALVLTPSGFVANGSLKLGDKVVAPDGTVTTVIGVFPQGLKKIYRVCFSDGSSTECCMDHLWHTRTQKDRDQGRLGSVKSLLEISKTLQYGKEAKRNHSIPMVKAFEFPETHLPVDPYVLGLLLGDGCFRMGTPSISTVSQHILAQIQAKGYKLRKRAGDNCDYYITDQAKTMRNSHIKNPLTIALVGLGLWGLKSTEKFIPEPYKFASVATRLAILRGLMDADGEVCGSGSSSIFNTSSERLRDDVVFLVESLGGIVKISRRLPTFGHKGEQRTGHEAFRLSISLGSNPFLMPEKANRWMPRIKYKPSRYIDKIEFVGEKSAQCILVDHHDHLYITNNFIVTHNTLLAAAAALHQTVETKLFQRALLSRPVQPLGRDIGFLPGTVEEKLAPWMAALNDSLELLFARDIDMLDTYKRQGIVQVEPLTYIRGRSIPNSFMIVDEAQNLTLHEIKTIITRIGEGSKIVLTGDVEQIDNPFVDFASNGLTNAIERLKSYKITGHVTLHKCERSELAELAAEAL